MHLDISEIVEATGAKLVVPAAYEGSFVYGLTWDSRKVGVANCFVGLAGERVDGNDYAIAAMDAHASCVLMTREPTDAEVAHARQCECALAVVQDGVDAITQVARYWRSFLLNCICIGVTGSVGKTTTKDIIASCIAPEPLVCATKGNQNNELGVPATILAAREDDTRILVVEIGMRGRHQIDALCNELVHPQIGVVTNVGVSHLELLGSRENIARAKAELLESLPDGGWAVIPADDDYAQLLEQIAQEGRQKPLTVCKFGFGEGADVRATDVQVGPDASEFELHMPNGTHAHVRLGIPGRHNVLNALAACAVCACLGRSAQAMAEGLRSLRITSGRLEVICAPGGYKVIDDAYNASPDSMRAALEVLADMDVRGRRMAVLGDMGELGSDEARMHEEVGAEAQAAGVDLLVCVGELARHIAAGAIAAGMCEDAVLSCDDVSQALRLLEGRVREGDAVLVKASHSMGLGLVAKGLAELPC